MSDRRDKRLRIPDSARRALAETLNMEVRLLPRSSAVEREQVARDRLRNAQATKRTMHSVHHKRRWQRQCRWGI